MDIETVQSHRSHLGRRQNPYLCAYKFPQGSQGRDSYHIDPLLLCLARRYQLWSQSRCDLPCRAMRPNNRSRVPGICQGVECALLGICPALPLTRCGQSTIVTTLRLALHPLECRATGWISTDNEQGQKWYHTWYAESALGAGRGPTRSFGSILSGCLWLGYWFWS
jgi:hypothetical protein